MKKGLKRSYEKILEAPPFCLDKEGIEWVERTLESLSDEEKIGQLFCLSVLDFSQKNWNETLSHLHPGGLMYRPASVEEAISYTQMVQEQSTVPVLIAANLEKGGNGIVNEGTLYASPLEVAATGEKEYARKLALVCAMEAKEVGCNWAFSPIVDVDYNFRNPITNTRTFGSDSQLVKEMGSAYIREIQSHGIAATAKHFPGDGCDERDQHLVTTINDKSVEEWDKTYGEIYKRCIEADVMTIMVGHIMQPAYSKKLNPKLQDEEILPASLSKELLTGLLRGKLGFNGLICTDATTMTGFTVAMPRKKAVPYSIEAGNDMFLFTRNEEEDVRFMKEGYKAGILSEERLNEAVLRILGLKAALGLHKEIRLPDIRRAKKAIGRKEYSDWAYECADKAITLVKEEKGVLPLTKERYPRILYYPLEEKTAEFGYSVKGGVCEEIKNRLIKEGFQVDTYFVDKANMEGHISPSTAILDHYDLCLYCANYATKSNQTVVRIEWMQPMGANCPVYIHEKPIVFISVENPYHLLDVPRVKTYINVYNSNERAIDALFDKLTGKSEFKGKSPVDAFCGRWDTRL